MMAAELSGTGRKMSKMSHNSGSGSGLQTSVSSNHLAGVPTTLQVKLDRQRNLTLKSRPTSVRVEPLGRSSLRSKGSSNSDSQDKVKLFKNCLKKTVGFIFAYVGVSGVVLLYTIFGAAIFQAIETDVEDPTPHEMELARNSTIQKLWDLTDTYNTLNKRAWGQSINVALSEHQSSVVELVKRGFDGRTNAERWTFPTALMFTLSLITMIGYGDIVPRTKWGKIGVIIYAIHGIPVYILYFTNIGKVQRYRLRGVFARALKWLYTKAYRWNVKRKWKQTVNFEGLGSDEQLDEAYMDELEQQVTVPSSMCLWVMCIYLLIGTVIFAEWEDWNYLDSVYFCVTSLMKIGFGDLVLGTSDHDSTMHEVKLVVNFVYILLGMAIVAMCYYLLKEEVTVKVTYLKNKIKDKIFLMKQTKKPS